MAVNAGPISPRSTTPGSTPSFMSLPPSIHLARPHSASFSSVHFAPDPPSGSVSTSNGFTFPDKADLGHPPRAATEPAPNRHRDVSPPNTPAPTPKSSLGREHRVSTLTGGYGSSSSGSHADHDLDHSNQVSPLSRPRASTMAFPPSISSIPRSSSDRILQRENDPRRISTSRHSSRDILRSSPSRPLPSTSQRPSRVSSQQSSRSVHPYPKESAPASPSRRKESPTRRLREVMRDEGTASPDSGRSRKGKERAEPRRDMLASSLGLGSGASGPTLTADQINDLLADSDVATAIRLMGTSSAPSIPAPRPGTSNTIRTDSPESLRQPFLVHAPPALIPQDDHARQRNFSVSTVASSPRYAGRGSRGEIPDADMLARRRRASSRATLGMDGDGGHVPYTHYVPPTIGDSDPETEVPPEPPEEAIVTEPAEPRGLEPKLPKRKRISALFHVKHKRSDATLESAAPTDPQVVSDREKQKQLRDAEMREKERQRRNDEMEDDRYFRALQQVSDHPQSLARADQAKVHLWALYQHIFDGVENPPRLNPVALLRWKHKTKEQQTLRHSFESRRRHLGASVDSLGSSSQATSTSGVKGKDPFARWTFTLEDIDRYNASQGHVEYFIPPREEVRPLTLASVDELCALEHPEEQERPLSRARSRQHSSHAGSEKGSEYREEEVVPPSKSISNVSSTNLLQPMNSRQSQTSEPLSRSPSIEVHKPRRILHRPSQSVGHIGPSSIGHVLKAPFDKLGSLGRRVRHPGGGGDASDSTVEESPHRPLHPHPDPMRHPISPEDRLHPDHPHGEAARRSRAERFLRRPLDTFQRDSPTDDENVHAQGQSRRRLFLKGEWHRTSPNLSLGGKEGTLPGPSDRQAELKAEEVNMQREVRWREMQDAAEGSRTMAEEEARRKIKEIEGAIYTERSRQLKEVRDRLYHVDAALQIVDDNIRHYSVQMDQVRHSARMATGLDLQIGSALNAPSSSSGRPSTVQAHAARSTGADRHVRDRLLAADQRISEARLELRQMERSKTDTAAELVAMRGSIQKVQSKASGVDRWEREATARIDVLQGRLASIRGALQPKSWYRGNKVDLITSHAFKVLGFLYRSLYWMYTILGIALGKRRLMKDGQKVSRRQQALDLAIGYGIVAVVVVSAIWGKQFVMWCLNQLGVREWRAVKALAPWMSWAWAGVSGVWQFLSGVYLWVLSWRGG